LKKKLIEENRIGNIQYIKLKTKTINGNLYLQLNLTCNSPKRFINCKKYYKHIFHIQDSKKVNIKKLSYKKFKNITNPKTINRN